MSDQMTVVDKPEFLESDRSVIQRGLAIEIVDQGSFETAADILTWAKRKQQDIAAWFKPKKKKMDAAKQELLDGERDALLPYRQLESELKAKHQAYLAKCQREQEAEQRRLQAIADEEAKRAKAEEVKAAKEAGLSRKEVAAIKATPVVAAPVAAPSQVQTTGSGVSQREKWVADVTDFMALVRFVASNEHFSHLLQVNDTALRQLANAQKQNLNVPGVKVRRETLVVSRAR
jgi:hypothetical protein